MPSFKFVINFLYFRRKHIIKQNLFFISRKEAIRLKFTNYELLIINIKAQGVFNSCKEFLELKQGSTTILRSRSLDHSSKANLSIAKTANTFEFHKNMEIEQRLGLYQVFLKLYEHNRGLLDEILQLENTGNRSLVGVRPQYVQGTVQGEQVFLITNIIGGKTQMLLQPQHVWTLGRDSRVSALTILAQGVSRRHAAIQYIKEQGFYLIDLNSTNGSYVNGEQVYERVLLKDGDRIRLGNIAFTFGLCEDVQTLNEVSQRFLAELDSLTGVPEPITLQDSSVAELSVDWDVAMNNSQPTSIFLKAQISPTEPLDSNPSSSFSRNQQSQILDRFLNRQIHYQNKDSKSSLEAGDD